MNSVVDLKNGDIVCIAVNPPFVQVRVAHYIIYIKHNQDHRVKGKVIKTTHDDALCNETFMFDSQFIDWNETSSINKFLPEDRLTYLNLLEI